MEQILLYQPDGSTPLISFTLKDGKIDGQLTSYRRNGATAFTRQYKNGLLHGTAIYYHAENNVLWKEEDWSEGVMQAIRYKY